MARAIRSVVVAVALFAAGTATLIFVAPDKAVIWSTTPDGRPVFATLRKAL